MIALFRYAMLKSLRDGAIAGLLLGPVFMFVAPILGVTLWFSKAHLTYPMTIDPGMSPARTADMFGAVAVVMASFVAGLSSFWRFRGEFASRAISSFVLAARPRTIALAMTLMGAAAGFTAYIETALWLLALTAHLPQHVIALGVTAIAACLAAAAIGVLMVTFSSATAMVLPVYAGTLVVAAALLKWQDAAVATLIALVTAPICLAVAAHLLERRCAT